MENERSKLRKKVFTIVEQACHEIHGFKKLYGELQDKILLSGQSKSTLTNYGRKLAQVSLHFSKLPQLHHRKGDEPLSGVPGPEVENTVFE